MYPFPIGVMLDSFRTDLDTALDLAQRSGAGGIQVYATSGTFSPDSLSPSDRAAFLKKVKSRDLAISALCGDLGQGFTSREKNSVLIAKSKRILDLAVDLETSVVTTHIGVVPEDEACETYRVMQEACFALARYADEKKAHFAVETGPETAKTLKRFLDSLQTRGVAVNFDPANLVMVTGDDPARAVHTLKDYIVHTHAKDGRRLCAKDPRVIYGMAPDPSPEIAAFCELPLGEGDVDFPAWLAALNEIGYRGFLTVEREVGENPAADIAMAVNFLKRCTGRQ